MNTRQEEYSYDKIGNRLSETVTQRYPVSRTYIYYENSSRLKSNGKYSFSYDPNGNLIKKETISGEKIIWKYEYDLFNRLVKVTKNDSVVAGYMYDEAGLRVKKQGVNSAIYYTFDTGGNVLFEQENREYMEYVYVLGKHFARIDGNLNNGIGKKYFYHTDHLGSTILVTDETGKTVWSTDYTPFGKAAAIEGELKGNIKFTGKDYDEDIELYYCNARFYDPELGRFITEDSVNDPNNPNLYVYSRNNPLTITDPSGNLSVDDVIKWGKEQLQKVKEWLNSPAASTDRKELEEKQEQGYYGFLYDYSLGMMFGVDVAALYEKYVKEGKINPENYSREQFANDIGPFLEYQYATSTTKGQSINDNVSFYANLWMTAYCIASLRPGALTESAEKEGAIVTSSTKINYYFDESVSRFRDALTGRFVSINTIAKELATDPDTAYFWSGRTQGVGGESVARSIAESNGGVTLEKLFESRGVIMPKWDATNPNSIKIWKNISRAYASQTSGTVRAVIGESLRPGNVWAEELVVLKQNPNVTQIIQVDPLTGAERVIFRR
jgi:RHS repeat-associated protein